MQCHEYKLVSVSSCEHKHTPWLFKPGSLSKSATRTPPQQFAPGWFPSGQLFENIFSLDSSHPQFPNSDNYPSNNSLPPSKNLELSRRNLCGVRGYCPGWTLDGDCPRGSLLGAEYEYKSILTRVCALRGEYVLTTGLVWNSINMYCSSCPVLFELILGCKIEKTTYENDKMYTFV